MKSKIRTVSLYLIATLIFVLIFIIYNRPKNIVITSNDVLGGIIKFDNNTIMENRDGVEVEGNALYINTSGTFELVGSSDDVRVEVNAPGKDVKLVLNNLDISSQTSSVIYIKAGNVTIIAQEGSSNTLSDNSFERTLSATIYSEEDITFDGNGTLIINGKYDDAIKSLKNINVVKGNYDINAATNGITAKELRVNAGYVTILDSANGMVANNIEINKGVVTINASDNGIYSSEGNGYLTINGGETNINSDRKTLNINGPINLNAGKLNISNQSNDALISTTDLIIKNTELKGMSVENQNVIISDSSTKNVALINFLTPLSMGSLRISDGVDDVFFEMLSGSVKSVIISSSMLSSGKMFSIYYNDTLIKSFSINGTFTNVIS